MKKIILFVVLTLLLFPKTILASNTTGAKIGNMYYDNLIDAINAAQENATIKLLSNAALEKGIILTKNITIDLNGNTISSPTSVFEVQKGVLTITGKGIIRETEPNYGVIRVIGSEIPTDEKYSIVKVGKDVTLEGWAGIFVSHKDKKSYGVNVYLEGKVNAVSDISGGVGIGVYINGSIQEKNNEPVINIMDGAIINSNGVGIYVGGYSNVIINKASITGVENGLGIKAGNIEINGATIICTGEDYTPTEGYSNGILKSGTSIQIESNTGYAGDINLNIKDGNFISKHSNVLYEYIGKGTTTQVDNINISGGTFNSEENKNVFLLSNSFKNIHSKFVSGGKYTSNIDEYLLSGFETSLDNNYYVVTSNTMKSVFYETNSTASKITSLIITIVIITILSIIAYINRDKIIKFVKK